MRDKNQTEIFDNLSQTWSHSFIDDGAVIADECPMSEKAILYAMGELDADEIHEITGHFHNCRFCLDLVLDLRVAEDESRQSADQMVDILPALANAIQKSNDEKLSVALPEKLIAPFSYFWSYLFKRKNSGKIVQIKKDRIIIEEKIENSSGEITLHKVELKLHNKS